MADEMAISLVVCVMLYLVYEVSLGDWGVDDAE